MTHSKTQISTSLKKCLRSGKWAVGAYLRGDSFLGFQHEAVCWGHLGELAGMVRKRLAHATDTVIATRHAHG